VSKSPAKKAPARKKAAAGKAAPRKAAAKSPARPKAPAKPAKPVKAAAKSRAKPAPKAKPVAKPVARPAAKANARPVAKPAPKVAATAKGHSAAPHKPAARDVKPSINPTIVPTKAPAPKPAVAALPVTPKPVSPAPYAAPITLSKTSDKPLANPATTAAGTRFTERFAPPRPPQRVLPEPVELVRPTIKSDPRLVNAWKNKSGRDLNEDELLAMPDAEYMNEKQLEFFRSRLQALKDDLLSNAGETTEHLREDTSIVPDPADRATIEEEHALELRTRDRERKLLKKISQSLARIDAGDYGYCDETGEPIGLGRLLARPTATLSLEAQQRRELKQKMFGD
jgi:DnaK suppressor protein